MKQNVPYIRFFCSSSMLHVKCFAGVPYLQWRSVRDEGHMKQRCAGVLFTSVAFAFAAEMKGTEQTKQFSGG